MDSMIKKYLPYAIVIFLIYMLVPLIFISSAMARFSAVAYDFVFPVTAAVCAAIYCSKHGLDFLFALIAPLIYIPSMLIYNGGFSSSNITTNLILLVVYLVSGIFGLFLGDLALGDERRKREKKEKAEAEKMLLEAKHRDEIELKKMTRTSGSQITRSNKNIRNTRNTRNTPSYDDDFDYDKYLSAIDRPKNTTESEIDDILREFGSSNR